MKKGCYGKYCPQIQNTMSQDAFEFMRWSINFEDNSKARARTDPLFDPLWKIQNVMNKITSALSNDFQRNSFWTISFPILHIVLGNKINSILGENIVLPKALQRLKFQKGHCSEIRYSIKQLKMWNFVFWLNKFLLIQLCLKMN